MVNRLDAAVIGTGQAGPSLANRLTPGSVIGPLAMRGNMRFVDKMGKYRAALRLMALRYATAIDYSPRNAFAWPAADVQAHPGNCTWRCTRSVIFSQWLRR